jgi:hypothetical protein
LQFALVILIPSHVPWARTGVVAKARMARKIKIVERTPTSPFAGRQTSANDWRSS